MSTNQSSGLVNVIDGVPFTTSEIVAENAGIEHRAALQLLETHHGVIEEAFGTIAFEMRRSGGRPTRFARLTEAQSTALLTLMRNTPQVVDFKVNLVKAFAEATRTSVPALPSRAALAQMVLDAEKELEAAKMQAELDAPKVRYHERFVAETDDIMTIEYFASHWGTTEPQVRKMLIEKKIAVRRCIGKKWSKSKGCMVDEFEWRPRQGTRYVEWFKVLPQHNAPRHHNGQVRQTMYLFSFHSEDLAAKIGLTQPVMFDGGDAA